MQLQKTKEENTLPNGIRWKDVEKLVETRYKKQIQKLSNETLERIIDDHSLALQYAKGGIQEFAPENSNALYINSMVKAMQKLAMIILQIRVKK